MTYTEIKYLIQDTDIDYIRECYDDGVLDDYDSEVISAAYHSDIQACDIGECYQGEFRSDEEFVEDLLDQDGDIPKDLPHYVYIDWERTARDVMYDYTEYSGHYFRII